MLSVFCAFCEKSEFSENVNQQVVNLFHSNPFFHQNASKSKKQQLIRDFI